MTWRRQSWAWRRTSIRPDPTRSSQSHDPATSTRDPSPTTPGASAQRFHLSRPTIAGHNHVHTAVGTAPPMSPATSVREMYDDDYSAMARLCAGLPAGDLVNFANRPPRSAAPINRGSRQIRCINTSPVSFTRTRVTITSRSIGP